MILIKKGVNPKIPNPVRLISSDLPLGRRSGYCTKRKQDIGHANFRRSEEPPPHPQPQRELGYCSAQYFFRSKFLFAFASSMGKKNLEDSIRFGKFLKCSNTICYKYLRNILTEIRNRFQKIHENPEDSRKIKNKHI